jgi:hypothetical protein
MFDSKFLADRAAKQSEWAKKGVKSGSGRPFAAIEVFPSKPSRPLSVAGGFGGNGKLKGSTAGGFNVNTKPVGSPHSIALAILANNPELRTGGMYKGRKINASHEHWEQVMVFDWLYRVMAEYYDDFAAVPMGGLRNKKTASDLFAEGAKSGYPDITGDVPKGKYHGLFIELKYGKNKPSDNQIEALNRKTERGYFAAVCYGHEEAIEVITEYLALTAGGSMVWDKNVGLWERVND